MGIIQMAWHRRYNLTLRIILGMESKSGENFLSLQCKDYRRFASYQKKSVWVTRPFFWWYDNDS